MVLAYQCPEHGYHFECDVSGSHNDSKCTAGQRVCPDDVDVPVTGITGSHRQPDSDGMMAGDIRWQVGLDYSGSRQTLVRAFDVDGAIEATLDKLDDPLITDVRPAAREHRRRL